MFWDFISLRPESTHQVMFLFSDRGIPDGYRHMNGYGSHTFKLVNDKNEAVYAKFHYKVRGARKPVYRIIILFLSVFWNINILFNREVQHFSDVSLARILNYVLKVLPFLISGPSDQEMSVLTHWRFSEHSRNWDIIKRQYFLFYLLPVIRLCHLLIPFTFLLTSFIFSLCFYFIIILLSSHLTSFLSLPYLSPAILLSICSCTSFYLCVPILLPFSSFIIFLLCLLHNTGPEMVIDVKRRYCLEFFVASIKSRCLCRPIRASRTCLHRKLRM